MEAVIIQTGSINYKFLPADYSQHSIAIGRSFKNDVITSDPHVAAHQLTLEKQHADDPHWLLTNLDNTNPVLINKQELEETTIPVFSGDEISIGRTNFTLYDESHPVTSTREFTLTNWLHSHRFKPLIALAVLLCTFGIGLGLTALSTYVKIDWGKLASNNLFLPILIVIWSCLWSLTGKLLRHHHYFFSHLFFTSLAVIILQCWESINSTITFILPYSLLSASLDYLSLLVVLGLAIGFSLNLSSNTNRTFLKGFGVSTSIIVLMALTSFLGQADFSARPSYIASLKPPIIISPAGITTEQHIEQYQAMFSTLKDYEKPD